MNPRVGTFLAMLVCLVAVTAAACSGGNNCNLGCSGHGHCELQAGNPHCVCDQGYASSADGVECITGTVCTGQTCSGHGVCVVGLDQKPACSCEKGYKASTDKLSCVLASSCSADTDCTTPPAASCTGSTYHGYTVPGTCSGGSCQYAPADKDCGAKGCCQTRCCGLIPSNDTDLGEPEPGGPSPSVGGGSFDTVAHCNAGSLLGDCHLVTPAQSPKVCVCKCNQLQITGSLKVTGEAALAILAWNSVTIGGTLDLSTAREALGPGAVPSSKAMASGMFGGAGGSNGTKGGNSGTATGGSAIIPLVGGQAGQDGCNQRKGGGGAGAVQISAGDSIQIGGVISADGGGGQGGNGVADPQGQCLGGAGGGSGGSILLEAVTVTVSGQIYANGGGAGGGGNNAGEIGGDGQDAQACLTAATGGKGQDGHGCALYENTIGGLGGTGAVGDQPGGDGQSYDTKDCPVTFDKVGGGGGGGGAGRIRINTQSTCTCTGTFSPTPKTGHATGT